MLCKRELCDKFISYGDEVMADFRCNACNALLDDIEPDECPCPEKYKERKLQELNRK